MEISLGNLIDQLCITNLKIFTLEDIKRDKSAPDEVIASATRKVNALNAHRNLLIAAIDEQFGKQSGINIKTH